LDKTPHGATLHFMDEKIDTGDIVHQKELVVSLADTGDTLYKRALCLELEVFKEAWPHLVNRSYTRRPQQEHLQTTHKRKDLALQAVQKIDLDATVRAGDLIDKMRALTTNHSEEASYFVVDGRKYFIQIAIKPESAIGNSFS
jgi:methionyl-tRNA formyltransferase